MKKVVPKLQHLLSGIAKVDVLIFHCVNLNILSSIPLKEMPTRYKPNSVISDFNLFQGLTDY